MRRVILFIIVLLLMAVMPVGTWFIYENQARELLFRIGMLVALVVGMFMAREEREVLTKV